MAKPYAVCTGTYGSTVTVEVPGTLQNGIFEFSGYDVPQNGSLEDPSVIKTAYTFADSDCELNANYSKNEIGLWIYYVDTDAGFIDVNGSHVQKKTADGLTLTSDPVPEIEGYSLKDFAEYRYNYYDPNEERKVNGFINVITEGTRSGSDELTYFTADRADRTVAVTAGASGIKTVYAIYEKDEEDIEVTYSTGNFSVRDNDARGADRNKKYISAYSNSAEVILKGAAPKSWQLAYDVVINRQSQYSSGRYHIEAAIPEGTVYIPDSAKVSGADTETLNASLSADGRTITAEFSGAEQGKEAVFEFAVEVDNDSYGHTASYGIRAFSDINYTLTGHAAAWEYKGSSSDRELIMDDQTVTWLMKKPVKRLVR